MNRRPITNVYIIVNMIVRFYSRIRKMGLAPIHMVPIVGKDQVTIGKTESKLYLVAIILESYGIVYRNSSLHTHGVLAQPLSVTPS